VQSRPRTTCSLGPASGILLCVHVGRTIESEPVASKEARVCASVRLCSGSRDEPNGRYRADRAYAAVTPVP